MSGLPDSLNALHLLFEEKNEEVSFLVSWVTKIVSECFFVRISGHECRREGVHKHFSELSILLLDDFTKDIKVLFEIRRDKFQLLVSLEEPLHLNLLALKGIRGFKVHQAGPDSLLLLGVWQTLITLLLNFLALIRVIFKEDFLLKSFLGIVVEIWRSIVILDDGVFLLSSELGVEGLSLEFDTTVHDPSCSDTEVFFVIHETKCLIQTESLKLLILLLFNSLSEEKVGDLLVELLDVFWWQVHLLSGNK